MAPMIKLREPSIDESPEYEEFLEKLKTYHEIRGYGSKVKKLFYQANQSSVCIAELSLGLSSILRPNLVRDMSICFDCLTLLWKREATMLSAQRNWLGGS
jgi:hypothetical protein